MIAHHKPNRWKSAGALAALLLAAPAHAERCLSAGDLPKAGPRFSDYAVKSEKIKRPAPVLLEGNADARRFRTVLSEAAKDGPNFAGHYTIAGWGCGTSCLDWGVIDAKTGKVSLDAKLRVLETMSSDWANYDAATKAYAARGANEADFDLLLFKRDSSLLIMLGAPNQDEARDGVAYYRWTGARFEQVKFVPAKEICRDQPSP